MFFVHTYFIFFKISQLKTTIYSIPQFAVDFGAVWYSFHGLLPGQTKWWKIFFSRTHFQSFFLRILQAFKSRWNLLLLIYIIWTYGCTNTGCSITSKEGRTTLVCTSTEMYYFVLFRKLHGLVGQTFHHLLGRQVKMKEEQLISAENTVGYNSKKNANWTR